MNRRQFETLGLQSIRRLPPLESKSVLINPQSFTHEPFARYNRLYSRQELSPRIRLDYATSRTGAKGLLCDIRVTVLGQEENFRVGSKIADLPGGFDPIQAWKADVQQNYVRLQFLRFLNRF
jgi:hypothetical protein